MIKKKILCVACFVMLQLISFANVDSLKVAFNTSSSAENKMQIAYEIAKKTVNSMPDTALSYLYKAIKNNDEYSQSTDFGICLNSISVCYFNKQNYDSVIHNATRSLHIFLVNGDTIESIKARKNIALAQRNKGNYKLALNSFFEILEFYKHDSNNVRIAATLNDIGNTYLFLKEYSKGTHYQFEALEYLSDKDEVRLKGNIYNSLGYAYNAINKPDSAILFYEISLELKLKGNNIYQIAITRNNLCTAIDYKKELKKSNDCLFELLKDQKKINDNEGIARTYLNLSVNNTYHNNCEQALNQLDSAAYYLQSSDDIFLKQHYLKLRSQAFNKCGDNHLAYVYLDSLVNLNDSIFKFQKQKEIFELDTKYQTQHKLEEIKILETKNAVNLLEVQKQRWQISFLIFFLLTFVGGGIALFFLFKQRQQKLKELAILKMREEERVRIARDMHDEIGSGLTRISFISEKIKSQNTDDIFNESISKIIKESRKLSNSLREIIWAIDPRNDKLSELLFYLRDYINEFSLNTGIDCKIDFPDDIVDFVVGTDIRRNLFLALKEILNNIAKHAKANSVKIKFNEKAKLAFLSIEDDGEGFDQNQVKKGLGIESIKLRTEKMGGVFILESEINHGTFICLQNLKLNTTKV